MKITEFNPRSPLVLRLQALEHCSHQYNYLGRDCAMHSMYCTTFWLTRGADSFKGVSLETMIDLNLSQPNKGIKREVTNINNCDETPYELWKGRPTNVKHFRVFGRNFYIKREDGRMGKFDSCVDKGVLLGIGSKTKVQECDWHKVGFQK
jgi:hypothetical protein